MDCYNDMLVTDIERIRRAKGVLKIEGIDRRSKKEALDLLKIYTDIASEFLVRGNEDERERAKEIMYELHKL